MFTTLKGDSEWAIGRGVGNGQQYNCPGNDTLLKPVQGTLDSLKCDSTHLPPVTILKSIIDYSISALVYVNIHITINVKKQGKQNAGYLIDIQLLVLQCLFIRELRDFPLLKQIQLKYETSQEMHIYPHHTKFLLRKIIKGLLRNKTAILVKFFQAPVKP